MILSVDHKTSYEYESEVTFSRNELLLKPRNRSSQTIRKFSLNIKPSADIRNRTDFYNNDVHVCKIVNPHDELIIHSESLVKTQTENQTPTCSFRDIEIENPKLQEFLLPTELVPLNKDWCETFNFPKSSPDQSVGKYIKDLMEKLDEEFEYNSSTTNVGTTIEEFAKHKSGVCQDFAHSTIAVCRQQNLPARYVSGYILTGQGSHASHAWVEIHTPDTGWVGFDPTNKKFIDDEYVVLAHGRDYSDCAPIEGIRRGGGLDTMTTKVNVTESNTQEG